MLNAKCIFKRITNLKNALIYRERGDSIPGHCLHIPCNELRQATERERE